MSEPNFSSATASVGDPVLCHLKSFSGVRTHRFPAGSMLAGHLEEERIRAILWQGYLKITFDRVIVPTGDIPLPAKVIQAKGTRWTSRETSRAKGTPSATVVEWMIPPLWPWKVVSAAGPRAAANLKGEEPMQLRLMDDIVVPRNMSASLAVPRNLSGSSRRRETCRCLSRHRQRIDSRQPSGRPPYASSNSPKFNREGRSGHSRVPVQQSTNTEKPAAVVANENIIPASMTVNAATTPLAPATELPIARVTTLVLKSNQVLEVTKYRIDGGQLSYRELNGAEGSVDTQQVDWLRTTQMTAEVRSVDLPVVARQTN